MWDNGDCTLIVTPSKKNVLIDGGGSENYDIGKKTLIPFLLDKGILKLDYIISSHMDTDHVGGVLSVIEELKIENIIISKQVENSENFDKLKDYVLDIILNVPYEKIPKSQMMPLIKLYQRVMKTENVFLGVRVEHEHVDGFYDEKKDVYWDFETILKANKDINKVCDFLKKSNLSPFEMLISARWR